MFEKLSRGGELAVAGLGTRRRSILGAGHPMGRTLLAVSINGNCETARECVGQMEQLTLREGLGELTLVALSQIVAPAALLHPFEYWCPICLEEWRKLGTEPYVPLLWQVRAVAVCSRHHCFLEAECPHCKRRHRPLVRHGRSGHCPWCQRGLGSSTPARGCHKQNSPHDFVVFMAEEVENLLSKRETILCPSEHAFSENIHFLRKCHGSSLASFAREVGHHVKERRVVDRKPAEATYLCVGSDRASVRPACDRSFELKTHWEFCATDWAAANSNAAEPKAQTP